MITFKQVNQWVKMAEWPLNDKMLEAFQEEYFGEFRHKYYRFFYHMVAKCKPKIALEIGVHHGHGFIHMAHANFNTLVVGIDKVQGCARRALAKYGTPNCRIIYGDSLESGKIVKSLVEQHGKIGVVFQDSSHHYEASHREFEIYSQFLGDNAIWCCDDIMPVFHDPLIDPPGKSMMEYFNEIPVSSGQKMLYPNLHHGSVIGVILL